MGTGIESSSEPCSAGIEWLTREESQELFNNLTLQKLGITGEEFLESWRKGKYVGCECDPGVAEILVLLPFANVGLK